MTRSFLLSCTGSALLLAAMACSDSTAPTSSSATFNAQVTADLAPTAGEDVGTDYQFYSTASSTSTGASFAVNTPTGISASLAVPNGVSATWISPACTYTPATQNFVCPTISWGGHTLNSSYTLYDATGATQSAYSATTTASINFIVNDTGAVAFSWNQNNFADTSSHHRNATVSGLQGDPDTLHIWNATGSSAVHSVRSGQIAKVYQMSSNDTTVNVKVRMPRSLNPYPLSGTMIRNYTVTRTRYASDTTTHTTTRRVVVTFNGTATVPMTVGTDNYTLNLDTHRVVKQ